MLDVVSLTHRYGTRVALEDVSVRLDPGQMLAILGPNGSGKSTLFRVLSTLVPPQSGTVRIAGHDVASERDAVRRAIGVVFQSPALDRELTVMENLLHHAMLFGLRRRDASERARGLLERFALGDRDGERVGSLSGGLRRRVELAKALLTSPRVLLLDEPSTGLDIPLRRELRRTLAGLRDDGVTIVLATHHADEAEPADRLLLLDRGRVVTVESPRTLREQSGGVVVTLHGDRPDAIARLLASQLHLDAQVVAGEVRVEGGDPAALVAWATAQRDEVTSVRVGPPTLEDAFVRLTGRTLSDDASDEPPPSPHRRHA
jgi:ABC-2 type transport system ATP-binding protein